MRGKSNILNHRGFRQVAYQIIVVVAIVAFVWWIVGNTRENLIARNIASGFDFLSSESSFAISQTVIDYDESSSFARALLGVAFLNTLIVAICGIILTTILGFVIGVARLSKNVVISSVAYGYVDLVRNIPLLLQIFFWYFAVLRAVPKAQEVPFSFFGGNFYINVKGIFGPKPILDTNGYLIFVALGVAIVVSYFVRRWAKSRQKVTGQQFPVFWTALGLIIVLPVLTFFAAGLPISLEHPEFVTDGPIFKRGFTLGVGLKIIPELMALVIALTMYTASFVAEIVRAGILAVNHGQTEAARSLGIRPSRTLILVVIPQAMRVIIPPLTSQYLNLTKNSSLAVAIAYPDLVSVGGTILSQSGQAIEVISIIMLVYLTISIVTSLVMNVYNKRVAIVER